jgi:hypothetical protein
VLDLDHAVASPPIRRCGPSGGRGRAFVERYVGLDAQADTLAGLLRG